MPLSNVERQVLALICDEHRQTRRGAKTSIVHFGMNASSMQQKARIVDVLMALKKRGLTVFGDETWLPTAEGERCVATPLPVKAPVVAPSRDTESGNEASVPEFSGTIERIGKPLPDDLLNRCAAMNAALLAQAKQAYAAGEPDAWRDLHWLMETARQLVALGGES